LKEVVQPDTDERGQLRAGQRRRAIDGMEFRRQRLQHQLLPEILDLAFERVVRLQREGGVVGFNGAGQIPLRLDDLGNQHSRAHITRLHFLGPARLGQRRRQIALSKRDGRQFAVQKRAVG
jgi:hypothetical protein